MKNKVVCNAIGSTGVCGECVFGRFHEDKGNNKPCRINKDATIIQTDRWVEVLAAKALKRCSFMPSSFDKTFVKKINIEPDYKMSEKGRNFMFSLLHKYRRQISNYQKIRKQCIDCFGIDPENNS